MNSMEQVEDNTDTFLRFKPVTVAEQKIIEQVIEIIEKNTPIPCTGCAYCAHGCPRDIAIPQYFALYNNAVRTTGGFSSQNVYYNNISLKHGKASDCIGCGQCESPVHNIFLSDSTCNRSLKSLNPGRRSPPGRKNSIKSLGPGFYASSLQGKNVESN